MAAPKKPRTSKRRTESSSTLLEGNDDGELTGWRGRVVDRSLERARRRSLDRGRAFIDAALKLLRESGGDDFTVQQVSTAAGQSLRAFYQHFANKDDLLMAVFEEGLRGHAARLRASVDRYEDPIERIAAYVMAGAQTIGQQNEMQALARFRLRLAESQPANVANAQAPVVNLARELIEDAVAAGVIPPCSPDHNAYIIVTLKSAYLHSRILGNEVGVELPTATDLARFCLEGLNAKLPARFEEE